MTLRSLLTLQIAFLLAGTSAPGHPTVLGVVVEAYRAHLGRSAVSPGATVYDGTISPRKREARAAPLQRGLARPCREKRSIGAPCGRRGEGLEAGAKLVQELWCLHGAGR